MSISENLTEFRITKSNYEAKYGILYKAGKPLYDRRKRICGNFSKIDQLRLACYCEPPMYLLIRGVMIPHAYGITLSIADGTSGVKAAAALMDIMQKEGNQT